MSFFACYGVQDITGNRQLRSITREAVMVSRKDTTDGCRYSGVTATTPVAGGAGSPSGPLPAEIAGVRVPDSALAKAVAVLVREVSPAPLFNHVARSYVFGSKLGEAQKLKFDPELLFVAAMMHDLGLTDHYIAGARFEVDGADAAARILRERNYPESQIEVVWEAIALHATMEIPERRSPEVALVHLGTFMDAGLKADKLPRAFFDQVFEALPQMHARAQLIHAIGNVLKRKPHTAYLAFEKDIALRCVPNYNPPNFCDLEAPAPFNG
jgi:HD domain